MKKLEGEQARLRAKCQSHERKCDQYLQQFRALEQEMEQEQQTAQELKEQLRTYALKEQRLQVDGRPAVPRADYEELDEALTEAEQEIRNLTDVKDYYEKLDKGLLKPDQIVHEKHQSKDLIRRLQSQVQSFDKVK